MPERDDQRRQVLDATDLVRLIGEQVSIKPRGKEFIGLCPFHEDHSPSMYVSPAKQIYKCFSCGAGGTAFDFVMNYHKMTFPEAIKHLAERAGIQLRPLRGGAPAKEGPSDRQIIGGANNQAVEFYKALYRHAAHGKIAREYVEKRGISPEMIEAFQIGCAPDRWDGLAVMIADRGWDRRAFEMAGLLSRRDDGNAYDRLRHRLIFPIADAIGRIIAFGGRKLREEDEPKYLNNSPETALFNKSATLYGLHLAKKAIIDSRTAVIVEGYTDVIACHQAGVRNVVATLGTALTPQHVAELRRYCQKVVLVYDGDEAGQKAADRAVEVFLTGGLDVAMAILPDSLDPAELFELPDGLEIWHNAIEGAIDALVFQFQRVQGEINKTQTITGREALAEEYLRRLAQLGLDKGGAIRRSMVLQRLAELLRVSQQDLASQLKRLAPAGPRLPAGGGNPQGADGRADEVNNNGEKDVASAGFGSTITALPPAERQVVGCLLRSPAVFHQLLADGRRLDEALTPQEITPGPVRELYQMIYDQLADGAELNLRDLLADLASQERGDLASLATTVEAQVDQACEGKEERLAPMALAAAERILGQQREAAMRETRRQFIEDVRGGNPGETETPAGETASQDQLLRKIVEQRRANPSPTRIARVSP